MIEAKRIIQPNDWSCLACVAAMITGQPLDAVLGYVAKYLPLDVCAARGSIPFTLIAGYLPLHGYTLGAFSNGIPRKKWAQFWYSRSIPAVAVCDNGSSLTTHAVLWTGATVLDPSPRKGAVEPLENYVVREWWPIHKWED